MIRNFRRMGWLILYLFGSSPAVCKSFAGAASKLPSLNSDTWYQPWATSLRMSDLGYSNKNQSRINISLNSLDEYVRDLTDAIRRREPAYEKIGVKVDGKYRQLNANLLQIENEYYSPVLPKRVARSGEQPTAALRREGIEYVEVRSLDINMFDPSGVNQNTMRFLEAFLIYCLLEDSPGIDESEFDDIRHNHTGTATRGRDPDFRLRRGGGEVPLQSWAAEILEKVLAVAVVMEREGDNYSAAIRQQRTFVDDPASTVSARIVRELEQSGSSFFEFALARAGVRTPVASGGTSPIASVRRTPPSTRHPARVGTAVFRVHGQAGIEAADDISLDDYLQRYFEAL